MNIVCPICTSTQNSIISSYRGISPAFKNLELVECKSCTMVFANPMPSEDDLTDYNASYFQNAHGGKANNKIADAFFRGIARLRYEYVQKFLKKNNNTVQRVLEIGPGPGYFAENWILNHSDNEYLAIESDTSCYDSLERVGVKLINQPDKNAVESVDLVVISHVLEHVIAPVEFLLYATSLLKKGGVLFIEVPCQDWKHKPLIEPHLLFFDKKPMLHLLRKLGFENIQISYHGQEIEKLRLTSLLESKLMAIRSKLISFGLIMPFAKIRRGMELLEDPLERAAVAPFKAHCESSKPAWWLRAIAYKS